MEQKGFLASLCDLSFTEFVTTRIIRFLYVLGILGAGVGAIAIVVTGFSSRSGAAGIVSLIVAPLVFLVYVMAVRIWLEVVIVVFRIAENTGRLVELEQGKGTTQTQV